MLRDIVEVEEDCIASTASVTIQQHSNGAHTALITPRVVSFNNVVRSDNVEFGLHGTPTSGVMEDDDDDDDNSSS